MFACQKINVDPTGAAAVIGDKAVSSRVFAYRTAVAKNARFSKVPLADFETGHWL